MNVRDTYLLALFALALAAEPVTAEAADKDRTISVSAAGYVTAAPDQARLSLGVVTEAKSAKSALEKNAALLQAVLQAIKQLGVPAKDIETEQFDVTPVYSNAKLSSGRQMSQIDGFRVHNIARVTLRDIQLTGPVIDKATESGANTIGAIDFIVSGLEAKLDAARREAMANAIRRAKLYAEAAGATLGDVITISEHHHGLQPRRVEMRARASSMAATPIEPGEQQIGVTVNGVWRLR